MKNGDGAKEVTHLIREARKRWDAHENQACRRLRERALAAWNTLSKEEQQLVPETHRVWLRYRSEKYFGEQRTAKGTGYGKAKGGPAKEKKVRPVPAHSVEHLEMTSPCGKLTLLASKKGLSGIYYPDCLERTQLPRLNERSTVLKKTREQLEEFFAGERLTFSVPLDVKGSAFQRAVWRALEGIPFGQTATYGELARELNQEGASRAVGLANGANPVSIILPCHRVVGANGKLTGYAGGLERKTWLLDHEVCVLAQGGQGKK